MWICGRPYPSDAGTGPSKRNLPERSVRTLPRPRGPYPFGPACQRTIRAPATGLQSVPRTRPYRTCPVPIFARRGAARPLCWNGPAPSFRVGWQAVDSPDAVRASAPPAVAAVRRHASIRSIAVQDRRRPLDSEWRLTASRLFEPSPTRSGSSAPNAHSCRVPSFAVYCDLRRLQVAPFYSPGADEKNADGHRCDNDDSDRVRPVAERSRADEPER